MGALVGGWNLTHRQKHKCRMKKGLVCRILSMLAKENVYWLFANISDKKRLLKLFLKRKKMTLLA